MRRFGMFLRKIALPVGPFHKPFRRMDNQGARFTIVCSHWFVRRLNMGPPSSGFQPAARKEYSSTFTSARLPAEIVLVANSASGRIAPFVRRSPELAGDQARNPLHER